MQSTERPPPSSALRSQSSRRVQPEHRLHAEGYALCTGQATACVAAVLAAVPSRACARPFAMHSPTSLWSAAAAAVSPCSHRRRRAGARTLQMARQPLPAPASLVHRRTRRARLHRARGACRASWAARPRQRRTRSSPSRAPPSSSPSARHLLLALPARSPCAQTQPTACLGSPTTCCTATARWHYASCGPQCQRRAAAPRWTAAPRARRRLCRVPAARANSRDVQLSVSTVSRRVQPARCRRVASRPQT
mmetsp:Transcript_10659/g.27684  ORF Transcript_10659/g.27684 Transcript_10659/m.27684 type:complete len:250 (-) Transcript_10659:611-1360(-)